MKDKIDKKELDEFFEATLTDIEEAKIKAVLKKENAYFYKEIETFKSLKLENKTLFFKDLPASTKYKISYNYIIGIAASLLLFFSIYSYFKVQSIDNRLTNWNNYNTIEKLKTLNSYEDINEEITTNQLIAFYENENSLNVKLKLIDCLKYANNEAIDFNRLIEKESAPMARIGLNKLVRTLN